VSAGDGWLHGYWRYDWADSYEKIRAIDLSKREILTEPPHSASGYSAGQRFYAINLLEELDSPGEWYLDRASGMLYFWPPEDLASAQVMLSFFAEPLMTVRNASHVKIRGITFECSRGAGVIVTGGNNVLIDKCEFHNLGTFAAQFEGGSHNGINACDIHDVGEGGVRLGGGDRATLAGAGNFATGNEIHHFNRIVFTDRPAVYVQGVGNRVAENSIHDAPQTGIVVEGANHVIESNDLERLCLECADCPAIALGGDPTALGNIIRENRFHELPQQNRVATYTRNLNSP